MNTSPTLPLSIIVIAYNMAREIPRTILSLSSRLQRDIGEDDYEIIVIDNGSTDGFDYPGLARFGGNIVVHTVRDASPSPVAAINHGLSIARGELIGVFIDGARIASPRLLATAREAAVGHAHPVIGTLAFHLGPDVQYRSVEHGYDQAAEDRLLASIDWPAAPYRLYEIAVFAGSSAAGWFTLPAESNALFLPRAQWQALGGYDTNFTTPGGGLVNLDTWYRACTAPEAVPTLLLGEGTFHQVHGGVATNATDKWPLFHAEYRRLRGHDYRKPEIRPRLFGQFPPEAKHSIAISVGADQTTHQVPTERPRSIVIVAGGHRTGTSATAGLLALLGLNAGDNLQAGDGHNAKGYFEDRQVVAIHDRLLGALRSSWDDPFPLPEGWPESSPAVRAADELRSVIDGLTASGNIAVTKDPRACRFLPLWLNACKKDDLTPLFVIPIRSPEASVASLIKRNQFPVEHAALLWITHLRDAEKFSRGHRRAFVHYESMLDDWQAELQRIDRTLGLAIDWNEALIGQGCDFISTELNHGDQPLPTDAAPALELARSIHRDLRQCVPGDDPGWIFERAGREIDRLAQSHLKTAAHTPSGQPSMSADPGPTATTASPAGKIPPPVVIHPRILADQQQRAVALKRIASGDIVGGAEMLIALAQTGTNVAEVYHDLGMLALKQSDRVAASELFSTAIAKSPGPSASTLELARLEKDEGHFEQALETLSPYLRAFGSDGDALNLVREILGACGELSTIYWARLVTDLRASKQPEAHQP